MRRLLLIAPMLLAAVASASGQTAKLTEVMRLDGTKEDIPRVPGVFVGPKGQMAIVIGSESQIRLYDSAGRRIKAVGRAGEGPGEFRGMSMVGWVGDTLWAHDRSLLRMTYFAPDGQLLRVTPMQKGTLPGATEVTGSPLGLMLVPSAHYADGSMLVSGRAVPTGVVPACAKVFFGFMARDGAITRIANTPDFENGRYIMPIGCGYRTVPLVTPPGVFAQADGSRYGFFVADHSKREGVARVESYRRDGTLEFRKDVSFVGDPVPSGLRDSLIASQIRRRTSESEGSAAQDRQYEAMARERIPRFYSPIGGARYGLDGSVWLAMRVVDDRQSYQVLDPRGKDVGRLTLPARSRLSQATLTHAWVVELDADDLPSVVRYRIDWPK